MQSFDFTLKVTRQTRTNMLKQMDDMSEAQLNTIPSGFNNNLIWNYAHVLVTQQLLCYGLSGLPITSLDKEMIAQYRKGGAPKIGETVTMKTFNEWQLQSAELLTQFELDYHGGLFKAYKPYTTSYAVTLTSVEEAFAFNLAHEAMHLGTILALRKLV